MEWYIVTFKYYYIIGWDIISRAHARGAPTSRDSLKQCKSLNINCMQYGRPLRAPERQCPNLLNEISSSTTRSDQSIHHFKYLMNHIIEAMRLKCNRYAFKVQPLCFWSATAMRLRCNRYAFEVQPLCVWGATAMRLRCRSYAFEVRELCFWGAGAMLLRCGSYAFEVQELCFWGAGAMLLTFFCIQNEAKTTPIYAPFAFS